MDGEEEENYNPTGLGNTGRDISAAINLLMEQEDQYQDDDIFNPNNCKNPSDSPNLILSTDNHNIINKFPHEHSSNKVTDNNPNVANNEPEQKTKYFYKQSDDGPYYVIVENLNKTQMNRMLIGKMLYNNNITRRNEIINISNRGKSKLCIEFKNAQSANTFSNKDLSSYGLDAYIPTFYVHSRGVIRHVDKSLTNNEILSNIESPFKVISIKRFTKRVKKDNETQFEELTTCLITFDGQNLPHYVKIFRCACKVEPYISPVVNCYNCLRLGHLSKNCKSQSRCGHCGDSHLSTDCNSNKRIEYCLNCQGPHYTLSKECPIFNQLKGKKIEQAYNKHTYSSTVNNTSFSDVTKNRFYPLTHLYNKDFPILPIISSNNNTQTNPSSIRVPKRKQHSHSSSPPPLKIPPMFSRTIEPTQPITNPYPPNYNMNIKEFIIKIVTDIINSGNITNNNNIETIVTNLLANSNYENSNRNKNG